MTAITHTEAQRSTWRTVIIAALAFWLSSSLILDLVIMPGLFATGMMTAPDFASAGYSIFGVFNRVELVCAALALTGVLVMDKTEHSAQYSRWILPLALGLLAVALLYTYGLTPEMSAVGLQLNLFAPSEVPTLMGQLHGRYWLLELFKLAASGLLLRFFYIHQN